MGIGRAGAAEQEEREGIEDTVGMNIKWLVEPSESRNACWVGKDMGLRGWKSRRKENGLEVLKCSEKFWEREQQMWNSSTW